MEDKPLCSRKNTNIYEKAPGGPNGDYVKDLKYMEVKFKVEGVENRLLMSC